MKKGKRKIQILSIFMAVSMMLLSACGSEEKQTEEVAEVVADNDIADIEDEEPETVEEQGEEEGKEEEAEEIEEEPLAVLVPYAEENDLEFCEDLTVTVDAVRIEVVELSTYEKMESILTITDVSIEELEDDTKSIVVKYEITGDLYDSYDGRFLQPIMPNALFCDLNTGKFQDSSSEILWDNELTTSYTVEWNGYSYDISQETEIEWSSEPDWKYDGKGGYIGPVTMYETNTFIVPRDYDSMGMVVGLFTADEIYSSEFELFKDANPLILEVLEKREGAKLYSINELYELFSEDEVVEDDADTKVNAASSNNGTSKENANNSSSKDNTTPKQEQPVHTHNYSSSVTKNPSCGENGVKTYTCSCGSSYTEAIPASGHQWVTTSETVSHPSTGHYETVTKKEIWCSCGASGFQSMAEYNAHAENCSAFGSGVTERTENVWVVDSEGYTETINITKCIVCGAQG